MKTMLKKGLLGAFVIALMVSCATEEQMKGQGEAIVKVTDAAVDAENIAGVYLSVSEVRAFVNAETEVIAQFDEPMEFDLMSYQNGATYFLGNGVLEAGTYEGVRFILSGETDSYVLFTDGTTAPLTVPSGTQSGYKINGTFEIGANSTTTIVADIDLRKALVVTGQGNYMLRPTGRVIVEAATGTIEGNVSGTFNEGEQLVVYAYTAGTYVDTEADEPAVGETRFQNSVNSAVVAEDGSFTLAFMPPGEYDLIVAAYSNTDDDEELEYVGLVSATLLIDGLGITSVTVSANASVVLSIII